MASVTMTASFLAASTATKHPSASVRRSLIVAKAVRATEAEKTNLESKQNSKEERSSGRRDLVFAAAAAAAAAFTVAKIAIAEVEPKRGTPEAKKKYGPVCVTMPTARICRN